MWRRRSKSVTDSEPCACDWSDHPGQIWILRSSNVLQLSQWADLPAGLISICSCGVVHDNNRQMKKHDVACCCCCFEPPPLRVHTDIKWSDDNCQQKISKSHTPHCRNTRLYYNSWKSSWTAVCQYNDVEEWRLLYLPQSICRDQLRGI